MESDLSPMSHSQSQGLLYGQDDAGAQQHIDALLNVYRRRIFLQRAPHLHFTTEPTRGMDSIDVGTGHHRPPQSGERIEEPQHDTSRDLDHLEPNRCHLRSQIRVHSPVLLGKC